MMQRTLGFAFREKCGNFCFRRMSNLIERTDLGREGQAAEKQAVFQFAALVLRGRCPANGATATNAFPPTGRGTPNRPDWAGDGQGRFGPKDGMLTPYDRLKQ